VKIPAETVVGVIETDTSSEAFGSNRLKRRRVLQRLEGAAFARDFVAFAVKRSQGLFIGS
jgi:hypothetical protein